MNEQLQAQIQDYLSQGRNASWIANEMYFENPELDYDEIKNYASGILEESKKKDSAESGEQTIQSITSVPSEEELASSLQTQAPEPVSPPDLSLKTIGDEFSNRFAQDQSSMFSDMMEQEEFSRKINEISANPDKSDAQKQADINNLFQSESRKQQLQLLSGYADEINERIGGADVDKEDYANKLYDKFGLAIPLDGDNRYNEITGFGGGWVDFLRDNAISLGTGAIDFLSGPISSGALLGPFAQAPLAVAEIFAPEQKKAVTRAVDQALADFTDDLRAEKTQYGTSITEKLAEIPEGEFNWGDAAEIFSRGTQTIGESSPYIVAAAFGPIGRLVSGSVAAQNTYIDSEREDYNRVQEGLEPIFEDTFSGNLARSGMAITDGSLTAVGGTIQSSAASMGFRALTKNPALKETAVQAFKKYVLMQGVADPILEGGVEALQETSRMVFEDALGNADYSKSDYTERVLENFLLGVVSTGAIATPGGVRTTLRAGAEVIRRPQAAANSVVEKNNMTSKDQQNIESLNKSQSFDNMMSSDFDKSRARNRADNERLYQMIAVRHPGTMKSINDIDLAVRQTQIKHKRAKEAGASEQELQAFTGEIFNLVNQRENLIAKHKGESMELTAEESSKLEDGRIAVKMEGLSEEVTALQEALNSAQEDLGGVGADPSQVDDLSARLEAAKQAKKDALRLMGEVEAKRRVLREEQGASATQAGPTEGLSKAAEEAFIAEQNLRNHLGMRPVAPKAEADAKPKAPEGVREATPEEYVNAMSRAFEVAKERGDKKFLQVSQVDLETAQSIVDGGGKLFVSEDGSAGAYVKGDGYMGGLFKSPDSELKGVSRPLQQVRRENGGTFFDAYGTDLERQYVQNGFRPVARIPFNEEYAPEGWNDADSPLKDKPDVVFFTPGRGKVGEGEVVSDYDAGMDIALQKVDEVKSRKAEPSPQAEPVAEPTPEQKAEQPQGESAIRGIQGQFDEYVAKEDGSAGITSMPGLTKKDVKLVNKFLVPHLKAIAGSNYKIVVHNTKESGDKASRKGGEVLGLMVENADGSLEIHLNSQRLAEARKAGKDPRAVIAEEVLHAAAIGPALRKAFKDNPQAVYDLIDGLEEIALKSGNPELVEQVKVKGEQYRKQRQAGEGEIKEEQALEYLTELVNYDASQPKLLDKVRVLINKFLKATLGKDAMLIQDISQADVVLKKLQRAIRTGEVLSVKSAAQDVNTERAALSPSRLPESTPFVVEMMTFKRDIDGGETDGKPMRMTFNGKWQFINWWKYKTNMGKGRGFRSYDYFKLVKEDGSTEPINADVMKNWKLKPPVYPEQKARAREEKNSAKRRLLSKFFETLNTERRKEQGQEPFMGTDYINALKRVLQEMPAEDVDYLNEQKETIMQDRGFEYEYEFAWEILYDYVELEEVEAAFNKMNEEFGIDDGDGITERAAIFTVDKIISTPDLSARHESQLENKAKYLCSVGSGTCAANDKVSLMQMESHVIKGMIGENPTLDQSVEVAAQALDVARQHILRNTGIDVADVDGSYNKGRDTVMNAVAEDPEVRMDPRAFGIVYDLLVAYTSNGSKIDPNLNLAIQLFASGVKRIQSGATDFIRPSRIEAIAKREQEGTLGYVRGDRANTMSNHLRDINEIVKRFTKDGVFDEKAFKEEALKRDADGKLALASMIGKDSVKLSELAAGNMGDKNAIPKDGHFRDQVNIFRGRFNLTDFSDGLVISEATRTSAIARLNALGASLNAMSSDAEIFAEIRKLKASGDNAIVGGARRVYNDLIGNEIEKLRQFDKETDLESTKLVKLVAKKMGLTPFQVQQIMYHDGIYSMSSYQGKPFVSDYKSAMERSAQSDFSMVDLDKAQSEQLTINFEEVDPQSEKIMPTPGRKLLTKQERASIDASESQLYRDRDKETATSMKVRGNEVNMSQLMVDDALATDATSRRILAKGINVEAGRKVGVRLNLNVMKNTGVPVQTVHDKSATGEALTYAPAVTVKNAELYVNQNAREKIVTFQENKFPMASVNGEFVASGTDLNYDGVRAKFNPFRHNVFVDMAGRPIKSAEEATIIGSDVFLRGKIEYYDMSDPVLDRGRIESEESRVKRTTRGPKYDKAVARFEGYAKGVLGMEFDSREKLEAEYDNMVISSEVAASESEVASNMAGAMERAAISVNTKKKMRDGVKRRKSQFSPDIRSKIVKDPRNYIIPQKLKELKKDVQDLTDKELLDIVNDEQLGAISMMNDNLSVLAQAERLARAVARGEADSIPDLIAEMGAMGTTAGRLLRHFREVKKSSPKGMVDIITAAVEAKGNSLNPEREAKLKDLAARMFQAQAEVEDLQTRAIKGERVSKELEDAVKRLKAVEREMDTFTNVVIERGWGELLGQVAQGNLLTTMSQVTNVVANAVNSVFDVGVDLTSAPVRAFSNSIAKLAGKEYDVDRQVSLSAYFYAMTHMGKNMIDTIDQVITGQDKDTTEWRQSRGMMPMRSLMAAISEGDIPPSQRAKLAFQGTFGVPAEVMFRMLSFGDTPFRKYFEDKNLYEQAKALGLEGEALTDFLKHPPRKNAERARTAGRRITFQEETGFSKGVNESISFIEQKLGAAMDVLPYVNGEQTAKALLRFMIPFRSTPANILLESATFASPVVAAARAASDLNKGDLDEASRNMAKGIIGAVVTETAVMLLAEGIMSGPVQWDEEEEKNLAYDQFPPTSINISALKRMLSGEDPAKQPDDEFVNYMKLGTPGALMAAVAVGYDKEELRERDYDGAIDFAKHMFSDMVGLGPLTAAGSMMEQSFLQGLNDFLQVLAGGNVERSAENLMNSVANVALSVPFPNQFSAIHRATREFMPDKRSTKDMDMGERMMKNIEYTIKERTFGGAEIPIRVDWKGNPIKQNPRGNVGWMYQLFDVTKLRQGEDDAVSQEIYRLMESTGNISKAVSTPSFAKKRKVSVPNISSNKERLALRAAGRDYSYLDDQKFVDSGVYFNTEQLNRLMAIAGKERYQQLEMLINSVDYQYMSDDERVEAMDQINDMYNSVKEYDGRQFKNHTLAVLDIIQEIYESGEQQEED
jgi:hypothetical protein